MNRFFIFFSLMLGLNSFAQVVEVDDINITEISSFSTDPDFLQGSINNSVEEVTGKVVTSFPIENVTNGTISYPVSLSYDGRNVFEQAQFLNQHRAQSTLGVGWSLSIPKITVDHKGTKTREDDTFYLLNGGSPNKLICTNKVVVDFPNTGSSYYEFQTEQYLPYKIRYRINLRDYINNNYQTIIHDYWEVTNDKGIVYTYGGTENARENVIAWGNWIGDSKNISGTSEHTTSWNLSKIEDQWNNNLTFLYEKIEQGINSTGPKHTEASYISEIESSTGKKIVFDYLNKTSLEYYEPHTETIEPDAYQERYEKKYLDKITTFSSNDELAYTYLFEYNYLSKTSGERKQYLKSVTQKNLDDETLPPQQYEYYTTGSFEGGLKKVTYPSGGSVTYNYVEKTIFDSTSPMTSIEGNITGGYIKQGSFSGDNYALEFMSLGAIDHTGRENYDFKVVNNYWVGHKWIQNEFIFPEGIWVNRDDNGGNYDTSVDNLRFVGGKDFYAFLIFNRTLDRGSVYLYHKEENGLDWKLTEYSDLSIQSGSINFPNEDPVLISGDNFVAVGENLRGGLLTFTWNGLDWKQELIQQEIGQFYYGASNNFIISLNEKNANSGGGGADMITGVTTHPDNYYIHYLDAAQKWQTKSWSAAIDQNFPYVAGTNEPSYLYPSNSMAGFMADNNPEYIIRWNSDYNVIAIDDVFGPFDDTYPLLPIGNNNFSLYKPDFNSVSPARYEKTASFDGSNWITYTFSNNFGQAAGRNNISMGKLGATSNTFEWYKYNPNTHTWSYTPLSSYGSTGVTIARESFSTTQNILLSGLDAYNITNNSSLISLGQVLSGINYGSYVLNTSISNGNQIFAEYRPDYNNIGSSQYTNSLLLDINKKDNTLNKQLIASGNIDSSIILNTINSSVKQFGGTLPIISNNILNVGTFQRIIDGEINSTIKDIVVDNIQIDNGDNEIRKVSYTYNDAHTLPDDRSTFYAEVVIENKGNGNGNNGKTIKYFNKGDEDVREAGLPTKVIIKDKNDLVKSENETEWQMFSTSFTSSQGIIGRAYHMRTKKQINSVKLNNLDVITETLYQYNPKGLLKETLRTNSNGEVEKTNIIYAYETSQSGVSAILSNKNMLSFPFQTLSSIDGESISVLQSEWTNSGSKYYINKSKSGRNTSSLRLVNEITQIDNYGNLEEGNNGMGIYKTILYGHNNLYPVATITNAKFADVINQLDVSYNQLQNLNNTLESELRVLYTRLPEAMININIYDERGRVVKSINEREEATNFYYDSFGREKYTTDSNDKVIEKKEYNFGSE